MSIFNQRASLVFVLLWLTALSVAAQLSFFIIHNHAFEMVDAFVGSSIADHIFEKPVLLPILGFVSIQIIAYLLLIGFIWFLTVSCSEFFHLSDYGLGIFFWVVTNMVVFMLNDHYFPASFFADFIHHLPYEAFWLGAGLFILGAGTCLAYYQLIFKRRRVFWGLGFLGLMGVILLLGGVHYLLSQIAYRPQGTPKQPNIILIGLDSVRPDYIGNPALHTPHIDHFLKTAVRFKEVYTPLARTFPAWVSILTAKHPKNSHARINLSFAERVWANDTLAKQLQAANYETFYATDEKRFSNITTDYGFDQVLGPRMGLNDFILGSLSDFPLTNLMIHSPLGFIFFPYNYANRAAAITYEPDQFVQMVQAGLNRRQGKPLFLALHLCVSHWPFTWAQDQQPAYFTLDKRYQKSVERVDTQLGDILQMLQKNELLNNSLVILLSDHGTSFGLLGDRLLTQEHYKGIAKRLNWVTMNKLSTPTGSDLDLKHNYSLSTAYGQGTDVLSLKQYRVLLAFKYFGSKPFPPHEVTIRSSLLDLAPTILAFLHHTPLKQTDGVSLLPYLFKSAKNKPAPRPFYLETGYSFSEIETNQIEMDKVLNHSIKLYQVNPKNGYIFIKTEAEPAVLENKQRAVLLGPWLLARYPAVDRMQFVKSGVSLTTRIYRQPPYYILANIETSDWTIGLDTTFAKSAPVFELLRQLKAFYGDEI